MLSDNQDRIRITQEDLSDPEVDDVLAQETSFGMASGDVEAQKISFIHQNWFYLMAAGIIGALIAWGVLEPYFGDNLKFSGSIESVQPNSTPFFGVGNIQGMMQVAGREVYVVPGMTRVTNEEGKLVPLESIDIFEPNQIVSVTAEIVNENILVALAIKTGDIQLSGDASQINLAKIAKQSNISGFLLFPLVASLVGIMIGCVEGILARNYLRALRGGAIGLGMGLAGGFVSTFAAGIIYVILGGISQEIAGGATSSLLGFALQMLRRSLAWLVAGMTMGLAPGIVLKSKKLAFNGFIGGMIGGLIGGLFFDPINYLTSGGTFLEGVEASRAIGFSIIGGTVGFMIGVVEMLTRDAWLLMTAGPLVGKQFIIYKNPTMLGSSPKCEIYLFKDASIEPNHAAIHTIRDGYEIEDRGSASGTWVNGREMKRQRLRNNDEIKLGEAKFVYLEREKRH